MSTISRENKKSREKHKTAADLQAPDATDKTVAADIVWDGSDGFDVSPFPSAEELSLMEEQYNFPSSSKVIVKDEWGECLSDNATIKTSDGIPMYAEVSVDNKVSLISFEQAVSAARETVVATDGQQHDQQVQVLSKENRVMVLQKLKNLVSKSTEGDESRIYGKDKYCVYAPNQPSDESRIHGKDKHNVTVPNQPSDALRTYGKDQYYVSVPFQPCSPLTLDFESNLTWMGSNLDSQTFDSEWHAGQEVHRERERLRHLYSQSLSLVSDNSTRVAQQQPDDCVVSVFPFRFSCGVDMEIPTTGTMRSASGTMTAESPMSESRRGLSTFDESADYSHIYG